MRAKPIAGALCGVAENIHALLRDVQHRMDIAHDPRLGAIERQLIDILQDIDPLIGLLAQQAFEELMAEMDQELGGDPRY